MRLPRPLDLTKSDFRLWGFLKENAYKTNPHTLEKSKQNIQLCTSNVTKKTLQHSISNIREMANAGTAECEQHFCT